MAALMAALQAMGVQAAPEDRVAKMMNYRQRQALHTDAFKKVVVVEKPRPVAPPKPVARPAPGNRATAHRPGGNREQICAAELKVLYELAEKMEGGCRAEYDQAVRGMEMYTTERIGFRQARDEILPMGECGHDVESKVRLASSRLNGLDESMRRLKCVPSAQIPTFVRNWTALVNQSNELAQTLETEYGRMWNDIKRIGEEISAANARADVERRRAAMNRGLNAMRNTAHELLAERARTSYAPPKITVPQLPSTSTAQPAVRIPARAGTGGGRCAVNGYMGAERSLYWSGSSLSCGNGSTPRVDGESGYWAGLTCAGDSTGPTDEPKCSADQVQQALHAAASLVPPAVARKYGLPGR